ncbi:MAG: zinc ABC transporter substrate-binding protein [Roseibacillus sp.]|nr:zinc ABC transporter substrate-binding protein [Roseibacillus sp.]
MKRRLTILLAVTGICRILSGCGEIEQATGTGPKGYPYQIATTVAMISDIVRQVAGQHAVVEGVVGEGVDPHLYAASINDVKAFYAADVIFYNGLMLEGKMSDVLVRVGRNKPVHAVTEAIQQAADYVITDESEHYDPHVWMDVAGWMRAVKVVRDVLQEFDPAHRADYSENADAYLKKLEQLDAYAKEAVSSIPEEKRVLITAHDAFGYMARAYGLEVRGIQGLSTEAEAGLRDIELLVEFLVEHKIPAVFVESSVPRKSIEALIEGARAKGHKVVVGGELFSDSMGKPGTPEGTYIGMIDHNVTTIARALGGGVPKEGFQVWVKNKQ